MKEYIKSILELEDSMRVSAIVGMAVAVLVLGIIATTTHATIAQVESETGVHVSHHH